MSPPLYTHQVNYEKQVLGMWVKLGFRTTVDAVDMHTASCIRRELSGEIRKWTVEPL